MNRFASIASLKDLAKDKLSGFHKTGLLLILLSNIFVVSVTGTVESFFTGEGMTVVIISSIVVLFFAIFAGVLNMGMKYGYMKIYCGERPFLSDLFYGYSNNSKDFLVVSGINNVVDYLISVPAQILFAKYIQTQDILYVKAILVSLVVDVVLLFAVIMPLSQSAYLLIDFPELTAKEAIVKSMRLMKGNMARYFGLMVSFLPHLLLCALTLGVGYLFVSPYIQMSLTCFYMNLVGGDVVAETDSSHIDVVV